MFDKMVDDEKKEALKELITQMYRKMAEGKGDMGMKEEGEETAEDEMSESPMQQLMEAASGEEKHPEMAEKSLGLDDEDKVNFMKHGNKPKVPVKGSAIMIAVKSKMAPKKKGKM